MARIVNDGTESSAGNNVAQIIKAQDAETTALPGDEFIRDAAIMRNGQDLVLRGSDGESVIIEGYFSAAPPPVLSSPSGLSLHPDLVNSFVQPAGPLQYAESANIIASDVSPVGAVQEISGRATVTRTNGRVDNLTLGTPIYQGDVIETANGDSAVNIRFVDDSSVAVSNNARLAIDEYVFNPASEGGITNISILRGLFVFTSGLIGRDNPDDINIETPHGSIGIRGTVILGNADTGEITVLEGAIVLRVGGRELILSEPYETGRFDPASGEINDMGKINSDAINDNFAAIKAISPALFSAMPAPAAPQTAPETGSDANGETAPDRTGSNASTQDAGFSIAAGTDADSRTKTTSSGTSEPASTTTTTTSSGETIRTNDDSTPSSTSTTTTTTANTTTTTPDGFRLIDSTGMNVSTWTGALTFSGLNASDSNPAVNASQIVYSISSALSYGMISHASAPATAITNFTQADIDAGQILFTLDNAELDSIYQAGLGHPGTETIGFTASNGSESINGSAMIRFGDGSATIALTGAESAIARSTGGVTFNISGDNNSAYGSNQGDNFLINGGQLNRVHTGNGNNTVTLAAASEGSSVYGGTGSDTIILHGADFDYINGGGGTNRLELHSTGTTINMGGNVDNISTIYVRLTTLAYETVTINNFGGTIHIDGINPGTPGVANESFVNANNSALATNFNITGSHYEVWGGDGADTFTINGTGNSVLSGGGNDTFYINGDDNTVNADDGNGLFYIYGNGAVVYGGTGTNEFHVNGQNNTLQGQSNDDIFHLHNANFGTIDGGAGNDIAVIHTAMNLGTGMVTNIATIRISATNEAGTISIEAGAFGGNVFIDGDNNANIVINAAVNNISISGDGNMVSGNGNIVIDGDGNTFNGSGNITIGGSDNIIYGGADSSIFYIDSGDNMIYGGSGADIFQLMTHQVSDAYFDGGGGFDTLHIHSAVSDTVDFRNVSDLTGIDKISMGGTGQMIILEMNQIMQLANDNGSIILDSVAAGNNLTIVTGNNNSAITIATLANDADWTHMGDVANPSVTSGTAEHFTTSGGYSIYIDQALFANSEVSTI